MTRRRKAVRGALPVARGSASSAAASACCLALVLVGCGDDRAGAAAKAPASAASAAGGQPLWKPPPPPPPPTTCGVGCVAGTGSAVVRFQLADGGHTAAVHVEGNSGVFAVGPPVGISENVRDWSTIRTFHVPSAGVQSLTIEATGSWTLSILRGIQDYVEGEPPS